MKYTGNYNLKKPEGSDIVNIEDLNNNADIIDQVLKAHDDALTTKETPQGAQAKADAALNSAKQYTDQEVAEVSQALDAHKNEVATQTEYGHIRLSDIPTSEGIPRGIIVMWSGSVEEIPSGWALCDGTNGTPDLRDKFIVGAGNEYDVGDTGGEKEVTLSTSQIPSHRHSSGTLSISSDGDHSHSGSSTSAGSHSHGSGTLSTDSAGSHSHDSGTLSASSAGSHSHGSGTLSTNTTGSHSHQYYWGENKSTGAGGNGWRGAEKSGSTSSAGSHSHSISGSTASGGSHSHSITGSTASNGSHSHSITGSTASAGSHSHTITINSAGSHSHTVSGYTGYVGSGDSHENRPPYYALAYIMKL